MNAQSFRRWERTPSAGGDGPRRGAPPAGPAQADVAGRVGGEDPRPRGGRPGDGEQRAYLLARLSVALSFLGSALSLALIRPQEPPTERAESGHLSVGLRCIRHSRAIRASLAASATINFFNFVLFALFVLYANRHLGVGPGALGLVLGPGRPAPSSVP